MKMHTCRYVIGNRKLSWRYEKMKHTLGSWSSCGTPGHKTHGQSVVLDEATGEDIAIVYDGDANARLIAAAPDLLAAFNLAHKFLDSLPPGWLGKTTGDVEALNDFYCASQKVDAAIAKATSEGTTDEIR